MTDYGHDLLFGTFTTPSAQQPETVVALAQAAEAAGLDMVTFQDHPYNAGFLDIYTLMSWVAAKTTMLRVSANVTNLPLRPPAVLAKMAASIDLLSGGRFELGLGAGGFGDAVKSMGGPDLTTGERVTALGEAIDILRGVWKGDGQMFRHRGKHHDIPGVRSGPAPAHDIGIWLGAYKPRMLQLTGAKADGWLPSFDYIKDPDIAGSNRMIDEAARNAGRDPRDIRRLLNIKPGRSIKEWIDQLTELVLEHGFSGFLLAVDDPGLIRTYGEEIAPAVRAAVARERTSGAAAASASLARRIPTIDYDAIPKTLASDAIEPGHRSYSRFRHTYL